MKKVLRISIALVLCLCMVAFVPVQSQAKAGWNTMDGEKYYENSDGSWASGWKKIDSKWYYFDPDTYFLMNADGGINFDINGAAYAFDKGGALHYGWYEDKYEYEGDHFGLWYYAESSKDGKLLRNAWKYDKGKWYWFDDDYVMLSDGTAKIKGVVYAFNADGSLISKAGWHELSGDWYYTKADGTAYTGWQKIGGKWYYFSPSWGFMYTGAVVINNTLNLFNDNGVWTGEVKKAGWKKYDGWWYYVDSSGKAASGWKKIDGYWYYFDEEDGAMYYDGVWEINGKYYCFNGNGSLVSKAGWHKEIDDGDFVSWYYVYSDGRCAQEAWVKSSGKWYYFDDWATMVSDMLLELGSKTYWINPDGSMRTGWIQDEYGVWYYADPSSGVLASGWKSIKGEWYYFDSEWLWLLTDDWIRDSAGWCYMDSNGKMTKNKWIYYDDDWYYLKPNGYMAANEWAKDSNGWLYMDKNGRAVTDKWIKSGSDWYYMKSDGYMAANEWAEDSVGKCWLGSDGKMMKDAFIGNDGTKLTKDNWNTFAGDRYCLDSTGHMAHDKQVKCPDGVNRWALSNGRIVMNG